MNERTNLYLTSQPFLAHYLLQLLSFLPQKGHALTYSCGLSAAFAAVTHYAPKMIAIRKGYFGCHESFHLYMRSHPDVKMIDLDDEYPSDEATKEGEVTRGRILVWVETPLNPTGEARDLAHYAEKVSLFVLPFHLSLEFSVC